MFNDVLLNIRGAYSVLGMMMIGIGVADITNFKFDLKFTGGCFLVKFILWPLFSLLLIALDKFFIHAYDATIYKMLLLFSVAPLAANNVVIATVLDLHPDKVSTAVVTSTIFAIIYMPVILYFL